MTTTMTTRSTLQSCNWAFSHSFHLSLLSLSRLHKAVIGPSQGGEFYLGAGKESCLRCWCRVRGAGDTNPAKGVQPEGAGSNYIEFRSYKPIKANYVKSPANRNLNSPRLSQRRWTHPYPTAWVVEGVFIWRMYLSTVFNFWGFFLQACRELQAQKGNGLIIIYLGHFLCADAPSTPRWKLV